MATGASGTTAYLPRGTAVTASSVTIRIMSPSMQRDVDELAALVEQKLTLDLQMGVRQARIEAGERRIVELDTQIAESAKREAAAQAAQVQAQAMQLQAQQMRAEAEQQKAAGLAQAAEAHQKLETMITQAGACVAQKISIVSRLPGLAEAKRSELLVKLNQLALLVTTIRAKHAQRADIRLLMRQFDQDSKPVFQEIGALVKSQAAAQTTAK